MEAGYDVRIITLPDYDVRTYIPPDNVYGILAAPPCTEFSVLNCKAEARKRDENHVEVETVKTRFSQSSLFFKSRKIQPIVLMTIYRYFLPNQWLCQFQHHFSILIATNVNVNIVIIMIQ